MMQNSCMMVFVRSAWLLWWLRNG